MLSRAEMRVRVEHVLRGVVIAVLAVMVWQLLRDQSGPGGQSVSARGVGALAKWSQLAKAPERLHMRLDSVSSPLEREWLGALAGAGSSVAWTGDLPAMMIGAQPIASPIGGTKVFVAAPSGSSVVVSDDVGAIDTVRSLNGGSALTVTSVADRITGRVKGSLASTVPRESVVLHKILVIGNAGWESKFVVAALEEEGWKVDAFIRVAPGVDVMQGSAAVIDTSRYSAVVALDGAASSYANRIIEFARSGGGVVLASQAASLDAMTPLRAGTVGRPTSEARAIQASGSVSLATLSLAPIASLRIDAVPLEKRAGAVAIAARRIGAGRSLQLGYEDTWRWRMGGGEGAVRDHRVWWTGLVSRVAYAPRVPRATATGASDEAPMAGLVAAIGPMTQRAATSGLSGTPPDWMIWLFVLLALGLVGEVASRRLRGAS
jgi:hypothetical protein